MIQCAHCLQWTQRAQAYCSACGGSLAHPASEPGSTLMPGEKTIPLAKEEMPVGAEEPSVDAGPLVTEASLDQGTLVANRYKILQFVGKGGMGNVYKAHDAVLGRIVALKFLNWKFAANPVMVERFTNEVGIAQEVTDRHICRVHDIGQHAGWPFFSMEYAQRGSLFDLLVESGRPADEEALEIARQLSSGLAALHRREVLHRDLKPANVLFDRDRDVWISDLGLATIVDDPREGSVIQGTLPYMSPEQLSAQPLSYQSDIYSLGLVLYELFTGRRALVGNTPGQILRHQAEGAPPPSTIYEEIDPALEEIILWCLEVDPDRRPPSALVVLKTLSALDVTSEAIDITETRGRALPQKRQSGRQRSRQPFVSGRVVWGDDFLHRETELSMLFSRLNQGESSAIVGPRKSGKTSMLQKVREKQTRDIYLGPGEGRYSFHRIDLHTVTTDYTPVLFWRECLGALGENIDSSEDLKNLDGNGQLQHRLEDVFEMLRQRGHHLVLLLDEFEQLLHHPHFGSGSRFFASLRSLVINSGSLILVVASRLSVGDLNRTGPSADDGSPYFNYLVDIRLRPFGDREIESLLARAGSTFSNRQKNLVPTVAGRQPYLLQALSWIFFANTGISREVDSLEIFYAEFHSYYDHLWSWEGLSDRLRTAVLLLSFAEWIGRGEKRKIALDVLLGGKAGDETGLAFELRKLRDFGLSEEWTGTRPESPPYGLVWNGRTWTTGSEMFLWWTWEVILSQARSVEAFKGWADRGGYSYFCGPEEWRDLVDRARRSVTGYESLESVVVQFLK